MHIDFGCFDESATHPPAPRSARHAALLLLTHKSALRRHARGAAPLPGAPIAALPGASNCRI